MIDSEKHSSLLWWCVNADEKVFETILTGVEKILPEMEEMEGDNL